MNGILCPSLRRHTFLTMFSSLYHHEIFRSYYQWPKWVPYKRSRSEVKGQGHRCQKQLNVFRIVTPVWIHIWWWNDAQTLIFLIFFSRSSVKFEGHTAKKSSISIQIRRFRTVTPATITDGFETMRKVWSNIDDVLYCFWSSFKKFEGRTGQQIADFHPNWGRFRTVN